MTGDEALKAPRSSLKNEQTSIPTGDAPKDINPLDFTQQPVGRFKIFDVRYQGNQDLRILTTSNIPNMAYLYAGDAQIARARLTADKAHIDQFQLATTPQKAQEILDQNPDFPFRQQLLQIIEAQETDLPNNRSFDFNPSSETRKAAENLFRGVFSSDRCLLVPPEVLSLIGKDQPDFSARGLHIPQVIEGTPNPMLEDYSYRIFGWLLGNNIEVDRATELAHRIVYGDTLLLDSTVSRQSEEIERNRLAFHEGLHVFLSLTRQADSQDLQDMAANMNKAYEEIDPQERQRVDTLLAHFGYTERQKPEEFWTYYLSGLAYPAEDSHNPVAAISELGKHPNIQSVVKQLPFLAEIDEIHKLIDHTISSADTVVSEGKTI